MAKRSLAEALVIPEGAEFEANSQGWIIKNAGDVRLLGASALSFYRIASSEGDVSFRTEKAVNLDRIEAPNGTVTIAGPITVHSILADKVIFESGSLSVRSLVAESSIDINGLQLQADMIVAPTVTLHKETKGRATVIQSNNDLGATQLKGCFRMEDFIEIFPNGQEQISQYPDVQARMDRWGKEDQVATEAKAEEAPLVLTQPISEDDSDAAHIIEVLEESDDEELREELDLILERILGAYSGKDLPPQIVRLKALVEGQDYDFLRRQINSLYRELIQHHKKVKSQPEPAVTAGIRDLRRLLLEDS